MLFDLLKAFDTLDYSTLLKKLEAYGITDRNHACAKSYLSNRRPFIQINEKNTCIKTLSCGVR